MQRTVAVILALALAPLSAQAKGFLVDRPKLRSRADANSLQSHLSAAVGEALGCGGDVSQEQLAGIEAALAPVWRALPKNERGRVERRSLRYLAHRYFSHKSAFMIRGFEPSRPINASSWGSNDILSLRVPAYVESVLESQHKQEHGFDLHDAVHMVAALERLIFDSESELLANIYESQRKPISRSLSDEGLHQVLEVYMVHWMLSSDEETLQHALMSPSTRRNSIPQWQQIIGFVDGQINLVSYQREKSPLVETRPQHNALAPKFSFEDAHRVVGAITSSFAHFWDSECSSMKDALVAMDTHHTGRVPLSKFYGSAMDSEWRFGESESYLRELGALDETSSWQGKQVIIPNYIQAASNCIVSGQHYLVCCVNECEGLLREIEAKVAGPAATPSQILAIVSNMTSQTHLDQDDAVQLGASHRSQLEQIAATHNGAVPLHGRLFAQWIHYVFPRECPFPHKMGMSSLKTPMEYGDEFMATRQDMQEHAKTASDEQDMPGAVEKDELEWMSQWDHEEDLAGGSLIHPQPSPASGRLAMVGAALLLALGVAGAAGAGKKGAGAQGALLPTHGKFV